MSEFLNNTFKTIRDIICQGNKKVLIAKYIFCGLIFVGLALFIAKPSVIFSGNIIAVDGITTSCDTVSQTEKSQQKQSYFEYDFNGQAYHGKTSPNSFHHCTLGTSIPLLINGNMPKKYLVKSELIFVFIFMPIGLLYLFVFIPMVCRYNSNDPEHKWGAVMKKIEKSYQQKHRDEKN